MRAPRDFGVGEMELEPPARVRSSRICWAVALALTMLVAVFAAPGSAEAAVPTIVSPPTIAGTPQQGKPLNEVDGAGENAPTGSTYRWLRCSTEGGCTQIEGATAQTYVPIQADVGNTIEVQETASNEGGAGSPATSGPTATVLPAAPVNTALP